jgi:hypothetical protein
MKIFRTWVVPSSTISQVAVFASKSITNLAKPFPPKFRSRLWSWLFRASVLCMFSPITTTSSPYRPL